MRELAGISAADLAVRAGVTRSTISHVESGARQLSAAKTKAVADAIGVPIDAITYPTPDASEESAA